VVAKVRGVRKLPPFYDICGAAEEFADEDFVAATEVELAASEADLRRPVRAIFRAVVSKSKCPLFRAHDMSGLRLKANLMLASQLLVKLPHVQIEILLPIQAEHLLNHRERHPLGTGLPQSPIQQPVIAIILVAPVPPPHLSVDDPDDLGCLPSGNLLR
jgi:hypothetical protein